MFAAFETSSELLGLVAACGSALSWSVGSILFSKLAKDLPSDAMTSAKGLLSVVLLGVAVWFVGPKNIPPRDLMLLLLSGVLGIAVGDTLFFAALKRITPHAVVTMMMLGHVLTVAGAVLLLKERPSLLTYAGIAAVLGGVLLVLRADTPGTGEQMRTRRRGLFYGFLSVAAMSMSVIIAKPALDATPSLQATFLRMASGTVCMLLLGGAGGRLRNWIRPFSSGSLSLRFVIAVAVVTFGGFWLSLFAFKYSRVAVANTLLATEPVLVLFLSAIFLGQPVTKRALAGSFIAVAGVAGILASGS